MKNVLEFPDHKTIEAEASAWVTRLDRGGLSEQERDALREWIGRSPEHYSAIKRVARIWSELDSLTEILEEERVQGLTSNITNRPSLVSSLTPVWRVAFVAIFAAVIVGVFLKDDSILSPTTDKKNSWQTSYVTAIGEQQLVTLRDGSQVQLNTDTIIDIDFDNRQRKVRLIKGEALFTVAHDKTRPFLVYVGTNVVRAVGTAFVVKLKKDEIEVTVTEGRVELKSLKDDEQVRATKELVIASAMIAAQQTLKFNKEIQTLEEIEKEELDRKLAWRDGLIVFSGEPLSYVVEEVSRYTHIKFVIVDPALSDLRIGGRFNVGQTDAMLEVLETGSGIKINRINKELVYLSAAPQ